MIVDYFCEVCFAPAQRTNRGDLCTKHYETRRNEELPNGDEIDEGWERYKDAGDGDPINRWDGTGPPQTYNDHREQVGGQLG